MCPHSLAHALDGLGRPRLLVVGDLMLDRYTWGDAQRISQEAPVIVLRADQSESRPGGAANVANMLLALEADVTCAGVVGSDAAGSELRELLQGAGANVEGILADPTRPTSVKQRFVGRADTRHESQILRVDHESCAEVAGDLEAQLIAHIEEQLPWHDALLISDYGKGVCTERLLRAAIDAANLCQIPVIVDPSPTCELDRYHGVSIIKPNRREAESVTGIKITRPADALEAGKQLCKRLDAKMALLTLDRDGMLLVEQSGQGDIYPTQARSVYDITGAGDMVMATIGLCLAAGTTPEDAVRLANITAGMEVERTGVAVIYRDEIRAKLATMAYGSAAKIVGREQAGRLAEAMDSQQVQDSAEKIPSHYKRDSLFALRVRGGSMNRVAPDGAVILCDYEDRSLSDGRCYIFRIDGDATFKRYRANPDRLEPDTTEAGHSPILPSRGLEVVARVVRVIIDNP